MRVRELARLHTWHRARPSQDVGDPCEDCGTTLALCFQCGVNSRCLACCPYERPTAGDKVMYAAVRQAREQPEIGLLAGVLASLVPAMLVWAGMTYCAPGVMRTLGALAGAAACCAFLAAGAAWGSLPLPGELPPCRTHDLTPYDRRALAGAGALLAQIVLLSTAFTAA
ncbi:hypothetical protein [Streptomyces sp.]|uniref:hypothetical protein n=1 Tax=Streptomyces sp. TaxID=1931 RepID=UPI002F3EF973